MPESEDFDLEAFQAEVEEKIRVIEGYAQLQLPQAQVKATGTVYRPLDTSIGVFSGEEFPNLGLSTSPPPPDKKTETAPSRKSRNLISTSGFLGIISAVAALILLFTKHYWFGAVLLFIAGILFGITFTRRKRRKNLPRVKLEGKTGSREVKEPSKPNSFLFHAIPQPVKDVDENVKDDSANDIEGSAHEKLHQAEVLLKRKDIMQLICPRLKFVADNAFDISTVVTPILASVAGPMGVPLNALLFGAIAVVLSKHGVASICADYVKGDN